MTSKEAKARNELLLKENAEPKNIDPDMPLFGDYKEEFLKTKLPNPNYRKSNKNAKRYANLKCNLNHIKELDNYPLNQITTKIIDNALERKDLSDAVKHLTVRAVIECLNAAEADGICRNPIFNALKGNGTFARKYAEPKYKGYIYVMPEDFKAKFLDHLTVGQPIMLYLILIGCLTGLRKGELLSLRWSWINFDKNEIIIPAFYMKMSREFVVPMTTFIRAALLGWKCKCLQENSISELVFFSKSSIHREMRDRDVNDFLLARLPEPAHFHGIRKTLVTFLTSLGVPSDIAERVIAHDSRSRVTRAYDKYGYIKEKLKSLKIWNYYLYEQLPQTYKDLFVDLDTKEIEICKQLYLEQEAKGRF